jgi:hypothetical protein
MPLALASNFLIESPSINRQAYRIGAPSTASTEAQQSTGTTEIASTDVLGTSIVSEIPQIVEIDWTDESEQRKFASLERKVGRNAASLEEINKYNKLRTSRRAWIRAQTYLMDYIDEEREKAVLKKLAELQVLLRPRRA